MLTWRRSCVVNVGGARVVAHFSIRSLHQWMELEVGWRGGLPAAWMAGIVGERNQIARYEVMVASRPLYNACTHTQTHPATGSVPNLLTASSYFSLVMTSAATFLVDPIANLDSENKR